MARINTDELITQTKNFLSGSQVEALRKLKLSFIEEEKQKAFNKLLGSCLDGKKFNESEHIKEIQIIAKTIKLDQKFFDRLKEVYGG